MVACDETGTTSASLASAPVSGEIDACDSSAFVVAAALLPSSVFFVAFFSLALRLVVVDVSEVVALGLLSDVVPDFEAAFAFVSVLPLSVAVAVFVGLLSAAEVALLLTFEGAHSTPCLGAQVKYL